MSKYINTLDKDYLDKYFCWLGNYINEESKETLKIFIENEILKDEKEKVNKE